jgi:hypothetical protein
VQIVCGTVEVKETSHILGWWRWACGHCTPPSLDRPRPPCDTELQPGHFQDQLVATNGPQVADRKRTRMSSRDSSRSAGPGVRIAKGHLAPSHLRVSASLVGRAAPCSRRSDAHSAPGRGSPSLRHGPGGAKSDVGGKDSVTSPSLLRTPKSMVHWRITPYFLSVLFSNDVSPAVNRIPLELLLGQREDMSLAERLHAPSTVAIVAPVSLTVSGCSNGILSSAATRTHSSSRSASARSSASSSNPPSPSSAVETAGRPRSFSSRASRVLMLASRIRSRLNQAAASYDCTWAHQRPASLISASDSP